MKHIISACFFLLSWAVFSQSITVTVDKTVTLKELFKQIENQTDYKFAFTDQIDTSRKYFTKKKTYNSIEIKQFVNELNSITPIQFSTVGNNIYLALWYPMLGRNTDRWELHPYFHVGEFYDTGNNNCKSLGHALKYQKSNKLCQINSGVFDPTKRYIEI